MFMFGFKVGSGISFLLIHCGCLCSFDRVTQNCHDSASRFVRLLAPKGRNYVTEEDLEPLIQVSKLLLMLFG